MTAASGSLSLSLAAGARSLAPMRSALRAWLADVDAGRVSDIVLAVDEAVSNAIEHAGVAEGGIITVQALVIDTNLHIEICDDGVWKEPKTSDSRGRGLAIMNAVMDCVSVEHGTDNTRVVMSRQVR